MIFRPRRTNNRLTYNLRCLARQLSPDVFYRFRLQSHLERLQDSLTPHQHQRLDFYCKLSDPVTLPESQPDIRHLSRDRSTFYCDLAAFTRYYDPSLKISAVYGDIGSIDQIPAYPSIMQSRPVGGETQMAVIFKMDQVRHNFRMKDTQAFATKSDKAVWRGVGHTVQRCDASRMYEGNTRVDIGLVGEHGEGVFKPRMSIAEQLTNKFVISMQGVDLATNLHWIMASNSLCVMPPPTSEGWSMESWLVPGEHFVPVADDMSGIEEQMEYYLSHPREAEEIIANAQNYVAQFYDKDSEFALRLLVLQRYFQMTGQM